MPKLETAANVAAIVATCLLVAVVVRREFRSQQTTSNAVIGRPLKIPGAEWPRSNNTIVIALSVSCHYCKDSAQFYRRIERESCQVGTSVEIVSPQDPATTRAFLESLDIHFQTIRTVRLSQIGVRGTPTILLIDREGKVVKTWFGALDQARQREVLSSLN